MYKMLRRISFLIPPVPVFNLSLNFHQLLNMKHKPLHNIQYNRKVCFQGILSFYVSVGVVQTTHLTAIKI